MADAAVSEATDAEADVRRLRALAESLPRTRTHHAPAARTW
jgi:glyceraldehyde-3-phosphate dehydrogenase/erythrose-4-phosphate dehydrogenase